MGIGSTAGAGAGAGAGVVLVLIVALIVIGPLLGIWALNTLFPVLAIPYSLKTWFAMLLFESMLVTRVRGNSSS